MTNSTGIQVANKEVEMAGMVAMIAQFLTDATQLPTLRKELEATKAECESLKRQLEESRITVDLEREERGKAETSVLNHRGTVSKLETRLASLQHKFDTIQGIVAAAMAEAEADKPKPAIVNPTEPKPWTPTEPLRSVS